MHEALEEEIRRILKYVLERASIMKGILIEIKTLTVIISVRRKKKWGAGEKVLSLRLYEQSYT